MNYDEPRQRKDGRWDMTRMNDRRVWPIGYCRTAGVPWWADEEFVRTVMRGRGPSPEEEARYEATKHKYHDDGHATAVEASDCYREHVLDNDLRLSGGLISGEWRPCEAPQWTQADEPTHMGACDATGRALTRRIVHLGEWTMFVLCDAHANRATVELLDPPGHVHVSMHS